MSRQFSISTAKPLIPSKTRQKLRRLGERLKLGRITPHQLRKWNLTELANSTEVPTIVGMELAGHQNLRTYQGYSKGKQALKRKAVDVLPAVRVA